MYTILAYINLEVIHYLESIQTRSVNCQLHIPYMGLL